MRHGFILLPNRPRNVPCISPQKPLFFDYAAQFLTFGTIPLLIKFRKFLENIRPCLLLHQPLHLPCIVILLRDVQRQDRVLQRAVVHMTVLRLHHRVLCFDQPLLLQTVHIFFYRVLAHTDGGVPNLVVEVPELSEYYYGKMVYFFEKACGLSGYMLEVNPFDQPGVESYKKNMFALLGKPGYEAEKEALEARIK